MTSPGLVAPDWYRTHWHSGKFLSRWTEGTQTEVAFLQVALGLTGSESILDLGCGQGRHARALATLGHPVVGVDISPELVAYAQAATPPGDRASFLVGDVTNPPDGDVDVVLNLYDGGIGYLESEERNDAVFAAIAARLRPGGRSVIHVLNAEHYARRATFQTWSAGEHAVTLTTYRWDPTTRRLRHSGHVLALGEPLPARLPEPTAADYRLYTRQELTDRLEAVGLEAVHVLGGYDVDRPFDPDGKDLVVVSRKA